VKRKNQKRPQSQAPAPRDGEPGSASVLPMEIQMGDRFTEQGEEWEVVTHPAAMHGGKSQRARVQRQGLPATRRAMTWPAHERVTIRRSPRSAA
jgi:hypothetical protein